MTKSRKSCQTQTDNWDAEFCRRTSYSGSSIGCQKNTGELRANDTEYDDDECNLDDKESLNCVDHFQEVGEIGANKDLSLFRSVALIDDIQREGVVS